MAPKTPNKIRENGFTSADLYDYYAVGMKKEWYTSLYTNSDEGGKMLPRGILGTPALLYPFLTEFFFILWHVPPGLDFRYWCCREDSGNEGAASV